MSRRRSLSRSCIPNLNILRLSHNLSYRRNHMRSSNRMNRSPNRAMSRMPMNIRPSLPGRWRHMLHKPECSGSIQNPFLCCCMWIQRSSRWKHCGMGNRLKDHMHSEQCWRFCILDCASYSVCKSISCVCVQIICKMGKVHLINF